MILITADSVTVVKTDIGGASSPLLLEIYSKEKKTRYFHKLDCSIGTRFVSFQVNEGAEFPVDKTENGELRLLNTTYTYKIYNGSEDNFNPASGVLKEGILKKI